MTRHEKAGLEPGSSRTTNNTHGNPSTLQMPEPDSRRAAILAALRRGETLTHADALARGWGWRLAADVFALKEYGWPIKSVLIHQGSSNPIARYWMKEGVNHG